MRSLSVAILFLTMAGLAGSEQGSTGKTQPGTAVSGPRMEVEPELHDFGKAKQEAKLEKEFVLKNSGTADLIIGRISTSCGCTVAEPANKVIKPGESTTMKVTLETRRYSGSVERTVAISSNDPRRIKSIKVKAFVEGTEGER